MMYASLKDCLLDLEKNGQLIRVKEQVDSRLEMAAIHLRINAVGGPAILFENIKNCRFKAASNLFGTKERCDFLFRRTQKKTNQVFSLPGLSLPMLKRQMQRLPAVWNSLKATPVKNAFKGFQEIKLNDLPHLLHWPQDSGASASCAQVLMRPSNVQIAQAMLTHKPILLSAEELQYGQEFGLLAGNQDTEVAISPAAMSQNAVPQISIFVGGPPAHFMAASNILPDGIDSVVFAGILGGRRFRYSYDAEGYVISNDADFVITGAWSSPVAMRQMGSLGATSGYYAPDSNGWALNVHKVYARPDAIWQFMVPSRGIYDETTVMQAYFFEWLRDSIKRDVPGLKKIERVAAVGGGKLLLASIMLQKENGEWLSQKPGSGLLAAANRLLGNRYLADVRYLWLTDTGQEQPEMGNVAEFFKYALERADWQSDVYFQTEAKELPQLSDSQKANAGRVIFTVGGAPKRILGIEIPAFFRELQYFENPVLVMPGVVVLQAPRFINYEKSRLEMEALSDMLTVRSEDVLLQQFPLIIIADNAEKMTKDFDDFLWVAFTRCAPLMDIYGVDSFFENKHWGCKSSLIMDAREKPHHTEVLKMPAAIQEKIAPFFEKGGSLHAFRSLE